MKKPSPSLFSSFLGALVLALGTWNLSLAQPGSLDNSISADGIQTTAIGSGGDLSRSVVLQSDGKIVVAGESYNGLNNDFAVVRYNSDGALDLTFSGDGKQTTPIGSSDDNGWSVAIQSDGKIVVAGESYNGVNYDFAVARYNADGTLDLTFSGDGIQTTAIGSSNDYVNSVAIQSDGKIVVAGYSYNGLNNDIAVARYNSDGALDITFSGDGIQTTAIGSGADAGNSVAIQSDGKIVVAGRSYNGTNDDFAVARYNTDGTLDVGFSGDGIQTTSIGSSYDVGNSVAIQSDGKIVVAGESYNGLYKDFAVLRYNTDGALDLTFSGDGVQTTAIGSSDDIGLSVAIQSDGKIVMAGYYDIGGLNYDFAVMRYHADGTLDNTFSGDGIQTTAIGSSDDIGYSVAIQSDGKIVVAGGSYNGLNYDFAVVRYIGGEPPPVPLPILSGFESCEPTFIYYGVQIPYTSTISPKTGTNHARIDGGCSGVTAGCYDGSIITSAPFNFVSGCTYKVTVYAKAVAKTDGTIKIAKATTGSNTTMKNATGADIILAATAVTSTTAYQQYTGSFTVSASETKYIGFQLFRAGGGGGAGAGMYIDEVTITKTCSQCSDGILNGDETGIDCGGTVCNSATPVAGTISPASQSFACGSGSFSLALCGQTGNVQWQFSPDNTTWQSISGANSSAYQGTVRDTTYFRVKVTNDGCTPTPVYSNTATVIITGTTDNTWLTTGTTDWGTATNWSAGAVPTSCHNVIIPAGGTQPIITAAASCNNLSVLAGATLTQSTGALGGPQIYGDLIIEGTYDYSGSLTPNLNGGLNIIGGTGTYIGTVGLRLMPNSNYFLNSNITLIGINNQSGAGSLSLQSYYLVCTKEFTQPEIFNANSGTLEIQNTATITITPANTNWGTGTLFLNKNGAITVTNDDYYNLKLANTIGNTTSIGANITTSNNFIIDSATTTVSAGTFTITVGGTFTNNGTFTASTSTVVLNGSQAQFIQGLSATTFNNLTINNTSSTGVTLNKPANISGNLTLTKGKIFTTTTNILTLNSGATVTAGTATSFVSGPLKYITATGVTFPIGKGNIWRRLTISAPATSSEFIGEFFNAGFGNYAVTAPLNNVSTLEYWQLQRNTGTGNVTINLYWEDATASGINDCLDLTIGRWNGTSWVEEAATATGTCSGAGTGNATTTAALSTFGDFTYGSKSSTVNPLVGSSITTSAISPTTYCAGGTVSVPYTITGIYNPGNVFTAQLSDAAGSFATPTNIGTLTSQTAGTISAEIPSATAPGAGYRIRVISSSPVVTGTDNGANLSITLCSRYWVGNAGNWNDVLHWSTTSGGTSGASIPHKGVYVYFDNLSFSGPAQVVTMPAGVWSMKSFIPSGFGQQAAIVGQGQMVVGQ